jgi:hypothetical protein
MNILVHGIVLSAFAVLEVKRYVWQGVIDLRALILGQS